MILHNYLAEPEDRASLVAGVRQVMAIAAEQPLARYAQRSVIVPPSDSDADIGEHIRMTAQTIYHPTSSCRMGADATSVVDTELRVRGTEGLRVVDASVFPSVVRGNTNAPVIALAERAAELVRASAGAAAPATGETATL
jgi:choline dehydrogenase